MNLLDKNDNANKAEYFAPLAALKDLKPGDRIQTSDRAVYEVRGTEGRTKFDGRELKLYALSKVEEVGSDGAGGVVSEEITHTLNWPVDAMVRLVRRAASSEASS